MNRILRMLACVLFAVAVLATSGCNKLQARDQLNKGVQAYKNARYEEAIEHFKNAVSLDPNLLNARIYLATAYRQQYVPGAETEDNQRYANQAIEEYRDVLRADPGNVNSIKGIAYLYLQEKQYDVAKQYYNKAAQIDPNDPESYYSVAYIDWTEAYKYRLEESNKLGLKPNEPLSDKRACNDIRQHNAPLVDEGIGLLNKALQLRHDYDDAMAYMNLMYRERANYECTDPQQRAADLKTADTWVEKTLATKRERASKQSTEGIVVNQ